MNRSTLRIPLLMLFLFAFASETRGQSLHSTPRKKLVEFGWHSPFLFQYAKQPALYETELFDGISLKISEDLVGGYVFRVRDWAKVTSEQRKAELEMATKVGAIPVQDERFLVLYGASQMNWFSDKDWALVEDQIDFTIKIAKAAGCTGILWDPEPYGSNPWRLKEQSEKDRRSIEDFERIVRRRGSQFMRAIQSRWPKVIILSLRALSDFQSGSPFSQRLFPLTDEAEAKQILTHGYWALHVPFIVGMFEQIKHPARFIDGNEDAYYYTSGQEYDAIRTTLRVDALAVIPPEVRPRYQEHFELGHAVASNFISGDWETLFKGGESKFTGKLNPTQRKQWMEHNVYHALRSSGEYAWFYHEDKNYFTGKDVPAGFAEAILSAKRKIATGESLKLSIHDFLHQAKRSRSDR